MWELICDHEYKWGTIAADRSFRRSDGIPTNVEPVPHGAPGLRFSRPDSRVLIPRRDGDAWGSMRWVHLEVIFRSEQPNGTLIDADRSFRVRLSNLRVVIDIAGETFTLHEGLTLDVWFRLIFVRSGLKHVSGILRTWPESQFIPFFPFYSGTFQVPGVGRRGVAIGNSVSSPSDPFQGDIRLIRIARFDPRSMSNNFLARPIDVGVAHCWTEFFKKLKEALSSADVECAEWLGSLFPSLEQHLLQKLAQLSNEKIAEFRAMTEQYRQLWTAGKVGSPEMLTLMARLRDWLKTEGLLALDDPVLLEAFETPCFKTLTGLLPSLDCDPDAQALLSAILGVNRPN